MARPAPLKRLGIDRRRKKPPGCGVLRDAHGQVFIAGYILANALRAEFVMLALQEMALFDRPWLSRYDR